MDCPECKKMTEHTYLHNTAHGIPGTHMVGSERYECNECSYKMFRNGMLNSIQKRALQYVKNTNGGATKANFIEDHGPIGNELWQDLTAGAYINVSDSGSIVLTSIGEEELAPNV